MIFGNFWLSGTGGKHKIKLVRKEFVNHAILYRLTGEKQGMLKIQGCVAKKYSSCDWSLPLRVITIARSRIM
jgi:hypothetical protein